MTTSKLEGNPQDRAQLAAEIAQAEAQIEELEATRTSEIERLAMLEPSSPHLTRNRHPLLSLYSF